MDQRLRLQAGLGKVETVTLEKGIHASRRAVGLRPDHAKSWNNLGVALDLANDFPAAEAALRKALELDPGYGLAWLNLGGVRMNRQDWSGALAALLFMGMPTLAFHTRLATLDVPYVFWWALSLLFGLRALEQPRWRDLLGFAVAAALAVTTKDQTDSNRPTLHAVPVR